MRKNPFVPIYRATNRGNNRQKYERLLQNEEALPEYLDVELSNLCNYNCRFCPTGTGVMKRMKGMMSDIVADAIADNVRKYHIKAVRFIRWGEPTIHPEYISIIRKIKNAGALTHINTNGSLLSEDAIRELLDIHLDSIKFSFQGADEGTYNEMRQGGDYHRLLSIIKKFYEMRGDREYPYIQISTTLTNESEEQVQSFVSDIENYCDYYNIGYTMLRHLNVDAMNISSVEKEKVRRLKEREANLERIPVCSEAFDKASINWNGDVTLCCADYDNFMIVGNIMDNDLVKIYNSNAAKVYREVIANMQYDKIECCRNCYETVPFEV